MQSSVFETVSRQGFFNRVLTCNFEEERRDSVDGVHCRCMYCGGRDLFLSSITALAPSSQAFCRFCAHPSILHMEDDTEQPSEMKLKALKFVSLTSPEVKLSHVCKLWRDMMSSTPSFWTVICIGAPGHDEDADEEPMAPKANVLNMRRRLLGPVGIAFERSTTVFLAALRGGRRRR